MDTFFLMMFGPVAAAVVALVWLAFGGSRFALGVTLLLSLGTLLFRGWIAWTLRDGLFDFFTPESTGLPAWQKFWARFWLEPLIWCAFALATLGLFRWRRRRAGAA
ncbi:hypothetical protein J2W23_001971 [Variovorax boronicumulans]|uniref:hypothetical protein n=1 Tax=Variovorax boronicumulans TaxID=436515 RepID=UPI00278B2E56|nr:hypothetical protein [Variovorax boronicumulans]MDQ0013589.1 hypothetical protein [Variovorax boronicumulans]